MRIPGGPMMTIGLVCAVAYLVVVYIAVILAVAMTAAVLWFAWRWWRGQRQQRPSWSGSMAAEQAGPGLNLPEPELMVHDVEAPRPRRLARPLH